MSFGSHTSHLDANAPDPGVGDPYALKIFPTAAVRAAMEFAAERVRRARELPGAAAGMLARRWRADRAKWARRLRVLEAHNARVDLKARMLADREWRARVLHDLGGERGLARWERAWARWRSGEAPVARAAKREVVWDMPSEDEFWADEVEDDGEDDVEGEACGGDGGEPTGDVWAPAFAGVSGKKVQDASARSHGARLDREGRFRWAAIPRGRRGEQSAEASAEDMFAAKWGGRLARLERQAEAAREVAQDKAGAGPDRKSDAKACGPFGQVAGSRTREKPIPVSADELRGELGEDFQEDFTDARPPGRALEAGLAARLAALGAAGESGEPKAEIGTFEDRRPGLHGGEGAEAGRSRSRIIREAGFRESGEVGCPEGDIGDSRGCTGCGPSGSGGLDGEVSAAQEVES